MDLNRDPKERCVCAFSFDRSLQEVRKNRCGAGSHNLLLFLAGGVRFRKSLISLLRNMHTRARSNWKSFSARPAGCTHSHADRLVVLPTARRRSSTCAATADLQAATTTSGQLWPVAQEGGWGKACGRCHSWIHATTSRTTPLDLSSHPFDMAH